MASTPKAKSSHRGVSPDTVKWELFTAPDEALAGLYHPADQWERDLESQALLPTLHLYAQWLLGKRAAPEYSEVIYASETGLRHFLLHGIRQQRLLRGPNDTLVKHRITTEMIAHCWYHLLLEEERNALVNFAVTGYRIVEDLAQRVTSPTLPTLFATG